MRRYNLPMIDLYGMRPVSKPPRLPMPTDAKLVIAAYVVLALSSLLCAWARWGL